MVSQQLSATQFSQEPGPEGQRGSSRLQCPAMQNLVTQSDGVWQGESPMLPWYAHSPPDGDEQGALQQSPELLQLLPPSRQVGDASQIPPAQARPQQSSSDAHFASCPAQVAEGQYPLAQA
jgi:hypothetical protein